MCVGPLTGSVLSNGVDVWHFLCGSCNALRPVGSLYQIICVFSCRSRLWVRDQLWSLGEKHSRNPQRLKECLGSISHGSGNSEVTVNKPSCLAMKPHWRRTEGPVN